MLRLRSTLVSLAAAAALVAVAPAALANGRLPAANQLVVAPTDPTFLALRSTFGIIVSHDTGASWHWICETATGYDASVIEDPAIAITANNTVVAGLNGNAHGLAITPDGGCSWHFVDGPLGTASIVDVVVRPDSPHTILALQSDATGTTDAGGVAYTSQVWVSNDDAVTWTTLGAPLDSSYVLETIEVAATDDQRIYVSGTTGAGSSAVATMFVSTDGAASWTPHPIPSPTWDDTNDVAPYIAAVDPTDADRVYIRTIGTTDYKLIVSNDAGQSYYEAFDEPHNLTGFALSADGSVIYVGGPSIGVFTAQRADALTQSSFVATNAQDPVDMTCLARNGQNLLACSTVQSGPFLLGQSTDNGTTFQPLLLASQLCGPLSCAGDAAENECDLEWPVWTQIFGIEGACGVQPTSDASAPDSSVVTNKDAGADASTNGASGGGSSGCSCDTASIDAGGLGGLGAFVGAMALLARRRRARRG